MYLLILRSPGWRAADEWQSKDFGYAVVRIDCRGIGGTPGILDPFGLQRTIQSGQDAEGNGKHLRGTMLYPKRALKSS